MQIYDITPDIYATTYEDDSCKGFAFTTITGKHFRITFAADSGTADAIRELADKIDEICGTTHEDYADHMVSMQRAGGF